MRRINGVLLALSLVSVTGATAQRTGEPPHGERPMGRRGGPGDFVGAALRGIELSPAQQQQILALRQQYGPPVEALRGRFERGDSLGRGDRQGPPRGDRAGAVRRPRPPVGDSARVGRRPPRDSIQGNRPGRPDGLPLRGDTAEWGEMRAQMEAQRNELLTRVRSVLTAPQRQQFDQNLQEMQQRREGRPVR
jgi:Spy/CpxP family protein refolding chaperone